MKPLLVSYSDLSGGAARATYRLQTALRSDGVNAEMMVREKLSRDPTVKLGAGPIARHFAPIPRILENRLRRLQRTANHDHHSINRRPTRWAPIIDTSGADVVNLHWIGSGTMSIEDIGKITLPVVMTLHDMWAFSGSEHYGPEGPDARWRTGYDRANKTSGHGGLDLDRWTWERKRRHWRPVPVVCPSNWLAECARQSSLMADWPIQVIPYAIDLDVFASVPQAEARRQLGLPLEPHIVLFGGLGATDDPRKGYDLLLRALGQLNPRSVLGVVFGATHADESHLEGIPVRWMGHIEDDRTLATLYSAADVMVVPSRQDNLVQTGTEAQASGTPVVGFHTAGMPDVVSHLETGYLAEPFSPTALARGIEWVLEDQQRRDRLAAAARERAGRLWRASVIVDSYLRVYEEAMAARRDQH